MKVLIIRLDAPLVSFGAPMVDQEGVVQQFPALSMLVGLFGNALGWDHRDHVRLAALQERLQYAARIDRRGEPLTDYQSVDLGTDWMLPEKAGWTSRGVIANRGGGSGAGTHLRFRRYRADSVHTVTVCVDGDEDPTIEMIGAALQTPARPLFIGRKCCLPASPLFVGFADASSPLAALAAVARARGADHGPLAATWWDGEGETTTDANERVVPVTDERDWRNQIHTGRRFMREGSIHVAAAER